MQQAELKAPFGAVHMFQNGRRIHFAAEPFRYGIYVNSYTMKKPQGLYRLSPRLEELQAGDILRCEFDGGCLQPEGGDELMRNLVGTHRGYTIGMGAPDSRAVAARFAGPGRALPYETLGATERGFELRLLDAPGKYACARDDLRLHFIAAWEPTTTPEARRLIAFVTC